MDHSELENKMNKTKDVIHLPAPPAAHVPTTIYHIYFIPGNPGLISYYTTFLGLLHKQLNSPTSSTLPKNCISVQIYGESLGGFELANTTSRRSTPLSLQSQTAHVESRLSKYCTAILPSTFPSSSQPLPRIILIGHSVGAYIALEVLRRRLRVSDSLHKNIVSAILLFPTVTHIAASPNGLRFAWVLRLPYLPRVVGLFARGLVYVLGSNVVKAICRAALGMTAEAAVTTAAFLGSVGGVRQALWVAFLREYWI